MLEIFQEATIPKLSETQLYQKFDQSSHITENIKYEIMHSNEVTVSKETLKEILALIRLNGDAIAKKAVDAYLAGKIIIINNKASSKIPPNLPYIVMNYKGTPTAFIFADKVVNNITSSSEYTTLMAVMEAAYLALVFQTRASDMLMNGPLMLTLCNAYLLMVGAPLEQRLYMKGENLTKASIYIIAHFYKLIRGGNITVETIPFRRLLSDKVDNSTINAILDDVVMNNDDSFMGLIRMIMKINPIRYKDLESMYLAYFTSTCGVSLIFALENIPYLFLLITSANYKTSLTSFNVNKAVGLIAKKCLAILTQMNL